MQQVRHFTSTWFCNTTDNVILASFEVYGCFVIASVRVGKKNLLALKIWYGDAFRPRFEIDSLHLIVYGIVDFSNGLAVRESPTFYFLIFAHK